MKRHVAILMIILIFIATCTVRAGEVAGSGAPKVAPETVPADSKRASVSQKTTTYKMNANDITTTKALTLQDCYYLSLKQSETIAINIDLIKETEAYFLQALSQVLPHLWFRSIDQQQEDMKNALGSSTLQSLKPAKYSERRFNVTQTLFNGFKAFAAIRASKLGYKQRTDEKIRAEQLLLVDVSGAFYLLQELREDLDALEVIKLALLKRIKELRDRESLGRSRPSEVVNAKAQLYSVEATIEVVNSQEIVARHLLEFLTGKPVDEITDSYDMPASLMPEDYYVSKADLRPDVKSAKYARDLAKEQSRVIDSEFLPNVYLDASYYTQRTGFNEGVDWDVMIKMDIPIFNGTETLGRSKEYKLKAHESELLFLRTRRKAPIDIKDAYVKLQTALAVQEALRKAYTTAKLNYHLQRKDYERSLVNNLDVLASIQTLENAQRDYIHALYEAKRLYWQLRVAIGEGIEGVPYDII